MSYRRWILRVRLTQNLQDFCLLKSGITFIYLIDKKACIIAIILCYNEVLIISKYLVTISHSYKTGDYHGKKRIAKTKGSASAQEKKGEIY